MWDAIIVGARCAGSPLARFLARAGKRVLLLDAARFPSDQPMSTHFIGPFGMRILDELGLGDRVRAIAPPVTTMVQAVQGHAAHFPVEYGGCCPRRIELDQLLLEGAREAGAEVRLQHRVVEVLRAGTPGDAGRGSEEPRVVGVIAEDRDGVRTELRGRVVVGADGRSSTIGDLVGAEKYFAYEGPRVFYWAYWPRPAFYADAPYGGSTFIMIHDDLVRFSFPVNRDQLVIGVGAPRAQLPQFKADPRGHLIERLRADPFFGKLVEAEPLTKVLGLAKPEYFFRRAAGPGWALVGDAGLFKDPTPGLGITDALRDARALSAAICEGGDAALGRYWRQRDVDSLELFNFARDLGDIEYNNELTRVLFERLSRDPALARRMVDVIERRMSPYKVLKPTEVLAWTLGALARGRFGVLRAFLRAGKRGADVERELKRRRALLAQAIARAHKQPEREAA